MKKSKMIMICAALLASVSLTACSGTEETVSSSVESSVISETSESLGIYVQDTDNDGTPDKVVDRYGNDLSELYTLKEDGIYEGETLILPIENIQTYTSLEGEEPTESVEQPTEQPIDTNNTNIGNSNYAGGNTAANVNTERTTNNNTYTGGGNIANTGNTGGGTTNAGNTTPAAPTQPMQPQPTVHQPIYKQQWVVDKAAWTETVPVYSTVEWSMCTTCNADITGNEAQHIKQHMLNGENGNWKSQFKQIQTGTRTVTHAEEGHNESVLVCGGCTGTH